MSWENVEVASFPTAINLQVIKLDSINFANEKQVMGVLKLLQKSPNLCELHITAIFLDDDIQDDDIQDDDIQYDDIQDVLLLLKDPDSCIVQDLKMLKTIKIRLSTISTVHMLFVKMLLSKSPTLENVVFLEKYSRHRQYNDVTKFQRELLCYPRASPKAQIVW
ncbi:F-box/FBD/LRR-repeat protein At1g13570-like isoform X3 [Ipomoea triloba]|nr:F-box/FBD/LRR-repeat protein At1g13570-like isoform X3 [Ipomoea triloba]